MKIQPYSFFIVNIDYVSDGTNRNLRSFFPAPKFMFGLMLPWLPCWLQLSASYFTLNMRWSK